MAGGIVGDYTDAMNFGSEGWKQLGPEGPNQNPSGPLGDQGVPNHEATPQLVVWFLRRTRESL